MKEASKKNEQYSLLTQQMAGLVSDETNALANLSNSIAAIITTFDFLWVGIYFVDSENELVLGPFQGPVACTRIAKGKGVCGTAWKEERTILVPDVNAFPEHIACSTRSKSEIVLPIYHNDKVIAVLDVDSEHSDYFDSTDKEGLGKITEMISESVYTFVKN